MAAVHDLAEEVAQVLPRHALPRAALHVVAQHGARVAQVAQRERVDAVEAEGAEARPLRERGVEVGQAEEDGAALGARVLELLPGEGREGALEVGGEAQAGAVAIAVLRL